MVNIYLFIFCYLFITNNKLIFVKIKTRARKDLWSHWQKHYTYFVFMALFLILYVYKLFNLERIMLIVVKWEKKKKQYNACTVSSAGSQNLKAIAQILNMKPLLLLCCCFRAIWSQMAVCFLNFITMSWCV